MSAIERPIADDTVSLGDYLSVLRRRKWSIILITILAVMGALAYGRAQTPIYESSAQVNASVVLQTEGSGSQAPNMGTEQSFVSSDNVTKCASLVMKDLAFRADPSQPPDLNDLCSTDVLSKTRLDRRIQENVTTTIASTSTVMTISYDSPSTHGAQVGAQAFGLAYIHERTVQAARQLDELRRPLLENQRRLSKQTAAYDAQISKEIGALDDAQTNGDPTGAIQTRIQDLQGKLLATRRQLDDVGQSLQQLDPSTLNPPQLLLPAGLPQDPVSPDMILLGGFGLLAGLALGVALAFLLERLDDSLRGRVDLEAYLGAPVLAVVPRIPGWRNRHDAKLVTREQPKSTVAETYRTLRTSISFMSAQRGLKVILVSSPSAGEGKTTTAANLAVVLADAGRRVVLVSADLRKPRIHRFFGLQNEIGLSSVLAGEVQPWDAILDPGVENLRVLLSGPVPSRPAELILVDQMREVIAGLREVADYVIIDTAPILMVADSLALAPLADGVLFVADSEATSRSEVAHSRVQLDQVGATVIGSVLNNLDPAKAKAYRFGRYGYYYSPYGMLPYGAEPYGPLENGDARGRLPAPDAPKERSNP